MRTPANIAGHPIHPMLVTIPIGLWVFSLVCDLIAMQSADAATWNVVALYALIGGIIATSWQAYVASQERARAERLRRIEVLRDLDRARQARSISGCGKVPA